MKTFFSIIYYAVVTGALILGAALLLLQTSLLPGYEVLIVQSGSMEPAIHTGSVVVVQAQERYEAGEVITFGGTAEGQIPTTHRVVSEQLADGEFTYTTKGDANEEIDLETVPLNEVRGKVWLDIPWLGYLLDFARQPLGFVLLIGVPALLVAIEEITNIYSALRERKETKGDTDEVAETHPDTATKKETDSDTITSSTDT